VFERETEKLIKKGKIKIIDLPTKREEIKQNQILLLKDDLSNAKTLFEQRKFRGAYVHAFDALERIIDIFLIKYSYRVKDRYARKVAVGKTLGKEFLGQYEELFDKRKDGMYDTYGIISEPDVIELLEEIIPKMLKKCGIKI